jgi:putative flavoprotein involved in K+ transport
MEIALADLYSERAVAAGMTTEKADMTFASVCGLQEVHHPR